MTFHLIPPFFLHIRKGVGNNIRSHLLTIPECATGATDRGRIGTMTVTKLIMEASAVLM